MKKIIILVGVLIISFVLLASATANYTQTLSENQCQGVKHNPVLYLSGIKLALIPFIKEDLYFKK